MIHTLYVLYEFDWITSEYLIGNEDCCLIVPYLKDFDKHSKV